MWQNILVTGTWLVENYTTILTGLDAVLAGLISIFLVIPGPEPERTLQKVLDFIRKFSKK